MERACGTRRSAGTSRRSPSVFGKRKTCPRHFPLVKRRATGAERCFNPTLAPHACCLRIAPQHGFRVVPRLPSWRAPPGGRSVWWHGRVGRLCSATRASASVVCVRRRRARCGRCAIAPAITVLPFSPFTLPHCTAQDDGAIVEHAPPLLQRRLAGCSVARHAPRHATAPPARAPPTHSAPCMPARRRNRTPKPNTETEHRKPPPARPCARHAAPPRPRARRLPLSGAPPPAGRTRKQARD